MTFSAMPASSRPSRSIPSASVARTSAETGPGHDPADLGDELVVAAPFLGDEELRNQVDPNGAIHYTDNNYVQVGANAGNAEAPDQNHPDYLNGGIDEVRIYNRALSYGDVMDDRFLCTAAGNQHPVAPQQYQHGLSYFGHHYTGCRGERIKGPDLFKQDRTGSLADCHPPRLAADRAGEGCLFRRLSR